MRGETTNQVALIALAVVSTLFFAVFLYREIFPEYKTYQEAYVEAENFRSTYTNQPPPLFKTGVKQIVIPNENKGPPIIDRCTTCHVALTFQHFSPTVVEQDVNGEIVYDERGFPKKVANPNYVWEKAKEANALTTIDTPAMRKVLAMHPLIGGETRPFQYHSVEDMGCVICHGGNGRGLVVDRAHGAILDGTYEESYEGPVPQFLETDINQDPLFAKQYNNKPGHRLLFQTTPLLVGNLIESRCVLCHMPTESFLREAEKDEKREKVLQTAFQQEYNALITLFSMRKFLLSHGAEDALTHLKEQPANLSLTAEEKLHAESQLNYLSDLIVKYEGDTAKEEKILQKIDQDILRVVGTKASLDDFQAAFDKNPDMTLTQAATLLDTTTGSLYQKKVSGGPNTIDLLTSHYKLGRELYISQGCYACHKIAGFARGGVGPELTLEGLLPPWFIKQSIVWPQADLKTSTMPNYRLDHPEIENLMTFLLAQRNDVQALSPIEKKVQVKEWEEGKKQPWEEPLSAEKIQDVRNSQIIFASEGCAACHRLEGFTSNIGLSTDEDKLWFRNLFPEDALGSTIAQAIEENREEIKKRFKQVRKGAILEEIEEKHPNLLETFYSNFAFASRIHGEVGWKESVHQVLLLYIQEYGLGRLICPKPNWSGVYRSDQWLLDHFSNPQALVPHSIMPVFPFDTTKFLALTHMLNVLGPQNRETLQAAWKKRGFNPKEAYQQLCSQCHGEHQKGNGPVAEWIYPPPKNLSNPIFLRNLTKERAVYSITQGVLGTPMPPWGSVGEGKAGEPVLSKEEIALLVDWLFSHLAGESFLRPEEEVKKWGYTPEDLLQELEKTHQKLDQVDSLFDIQPNPTDFPDANSYYIKKKFFTPENLQTGQEFFELHCAACHGKDADGSSARASVMQDAKPRAFINFPWINSRDDLRLLRSIKFGVPGTSMTPWGDLTTPLQRVQLVLYIRSLTEPQKEVSVLKNTLYRVYEPSQLSLLAAREKSAGELEETRAAILLLQQQREKGEGDVVALFTKETSLANKLASLQKVDDLFNKMSGTLKRESDLYQTVGKNLYALYDKGPPFKTLVSLIEENKNRFTWKEGVLTFALPPAEIVQQLTQEIIEAMEKISPENEERKKKIERSKVEFLSTLAEITELQQEQQRVYTTWQREK